MSHPTRWTRHEYLGLTTLAAAFTGWAACGYCPFWNYGSGSRPHLLGGRTGPRWWGHGPFDWDAYQMLDWFGIMVGGFFAVAGLLCAWSNWNETNDDIWPRRSEPWADKAAFQREVTGRLVYELLLGVAAIDGHVDKGERAAVLRVMRTGWRVSATQAKSWEREIGPPADVAVLARRVVGTLNIEQRAQLWRWCHDIAAADGDVDGAESEAMQRIKAKLVSAVEHEIGQRDETGQTGTAAPS